MVNLEWYRTFKAIYQTGNLTRAAEELFISQPNVSVQLASLENHVGHKLFDRLPRKLVPTEYGKLLYTQIVDSIENLEKIESEFRRSALKRISTLRIGSPIEYAHNNLIKKIGDARSNILLEFGLTKDLIDKIGRQELDFVLATQKIERDDLVYEMIVEERFMILCNNDFDTSPFDSLIEEDKIEEAEKWLLSQCWISYDNKLSLIRRFWKENFAKRPLIKPHFVIPNLNSIVKLISLGHGISVISDLVADEALNKKDIKPLWSGRQCANNTLWLAYNPSNVDSERVEEIRQMVGLKLTSATS